MQLQFIDFEMTDVEVIVDTKSNASSNIPLKDTIAIRT